jgi:hypothetical protein
MRPILAAPRNNLSLHRGGPGAPVLTGVAIDGTSRPRQLTGAHADTTRGSTILYDLSAYFGQRRGAAGRTG